MKIFILLILLSGCTLAKRENQELIQHNADYEALLEEELFGLLNSSEIYAIFIDEVTGKTTITQDMMSQLKIASEEKYQLVLPYYIKVKSMWDESRELELKISKVQKLLQDK